MSTATKSKMTRELWAKLTPVEQRIKIAELCGWTLEVYREYEPYKDTNNHGCDLGGYWIEPIDGVYIEISHQCGSKGDTPFTAQEIVPDYLNDLNAMHEAEKHLCDNQDNELRYAELLNHITSGMEHKATAIQRAEAFVFTMEGA